MIAQTGHASGISGQDKKRLLLLAIITLILAVSAYSWKDPLSTISVVASSVGAWIGVLSLRVLFQKDEFGPVIKQMTEKSVWKHPVAIILMVVVCLLFLAATGFAFAPTSSERWAVWIELLCVTLALTAYVPYDLLLILVIQDAYANHLDTIPNGGGWQYLRSQCNVKAESEFNKTRKKDLLLRHWLAAHKTSYTHVDLPIAMAIWLSFAVAIGLHLYYHNMDILRTFISGVICFHAILSAYLFTVHCPTFVIRGIETYVNRFPFALPVECHECDVLWNHGCLQTGKTPYEGYEFSCPHLGMNKKLDYPASLENGESAPIVAENMAENTIDREGEP